VIQTFSLFDLIKHSERDRRGKIGTSRTVMLSGRLGECPTCKSKGPRSGKYAEGM